MKAAVYLRVSSKDGRQDEANQEPDCVRLCAARGWEPVLYRERESGAKERPIWRSVLEAARLGKVGAVVFWAMDRVGRSRVQVTHDIGALYRWGAIVASVRESWIEQPMGPVRDILLQFMAWVAEGERERLRERTRAGLDRARAAGKVLGRRPVLEGERLERFAGLLERMTVGAAAREMGLTRSSASTWKRRLADRTRKGAAGAGS